MQTTKTKMKTRIINVILTLILLFNLFPVSSVFAADKSTNDSWWFRVQYFDEGAMVYFPITVTSNYLVTYTSSVSGTTINYTLSNQRMTGIIENGKSSPYPFGQTISGAAARLFKNYVYSTTWTFAYDSSPGISDPDDITVPYKYTTTQYLSNYNYNELIGRLTWVGNGTIPSVKTLDYVNYIVF